MIDRVAALDMVEVLASNGITELGNMDLTELFNDISNLDFSNFDIDMIMQLIALIAQYEPNLFNEITIPAILTATTASDGTVTFESSSNVLNTIGALLGITGNVVDSDTLAQILETALGSIVDEQILSVLVNVLQMVDISSITISTGMPESTYLLYESAVPGGYELGDNLIGDTIYVSSNGEAFAYKGAVVRGAAELIDQYLNIDLSQIFIPVEQFEEFLGDTYDSYEGYIYDAVDSLAGVILDIFSQLGIELNEEQRAQVDQLVQNVTDGFVNGTIDSNDVLNTLVDGISDILGYTEDWFNPTPVTTSYVIQNDIYESTLRAAVTDCQGNAIEGCGHIAQEGAVIPALGVEITVEGSELGTVTLNDEAVTYGVANKVAYEENYTLAATPSEDAEFVGWSVGGKIISTDATYTTAAYADLTYVPVFAQKTNDFTVTFVDRFNMVLGTVSGADVAALEAMPETYDYLGYTFTGWSMSLEEVQALSENTVVTANYEKDDSITYTVSAPGCVITVDGAEYNNTAEVGFDQGVTVKAADGTATAWTVNGANAAYGAEYTFYVTSDVTVAYTSEEVTAVPTVAAVDVTPTENGKVRFLASRNVPAGYTVAESGFVYGKDYEDAEAALVLENATTGGCYLVKSSNTANDGQFALTFGIASGAGVAYARAYVIAVDAEGNSAVYYADVQSFDYGV